MQRTNIIFTGVVFWALSTVFFIAAFSTSVAAQSNDLAFPTALTENQISGIIKSRDLGDPRVTTYYFTFNGLQGDLFINVVTKNLSCSVDVFMSDGMRPLTNIIVYADVVQSETGRVIYLRKPEKLIMRIQGRTPNDDPAEFQIKFAGGFEAATPTTDEPPVPKVTGIAQNSNGVKVNSVGTIIAVAPKPKPTPKATPAEVAKAEEKSEETAKLSEDKRVTEQTAETKTEEKPAENVASKTTEPEVKESAAVEPKPAVSKPKPANRRSTRPKATQAATQIPPTETKPKDEVVEPEKDAAAETEKRAKPEVVVTDATSSAAAPGKKEPSEPKVNPLANVKLVIVFKDGTKVERPMTEVFRFTADQKTLTVMFTNGRNAKYPILDVASVTIQ